MPNWHLSIYTQYHLKNLGVARGKAEAAHVQLCCDRAAVASSAAEQSLYGVEFTLSSLSVPDSRSISSLPHPNRSSHAHLELPSTST